MARRPSSFVLAALALLWAGQAGAQAAATPAAAAESPIQVYRREVFTYQRGGRPDPFQPLLSAADLGYRVEDLRLTSIVYSPNPRLSVAVFALADSARRFRLRTGQRLGTITVAAIYPRRVDLRVEDFGVARIESITLQRPGPQGAAAAAPPPAEGGVSQPVIVRQAPPPAAPQGPLRRGGARNSAPQTAPASGPRNPSSSYR